MPLPPASVAASSVEVVHKESEPSVSLSAPAVELEAAPSVSVEQPVDVVVVSSGGAQSACTALVPFSKASRGGAKAQVAALKRKFLDGMEEKSPEERRAALQARTEALQAKLEEARATEGAPAEDVVAARHVHREATEEVEAAIQKELEAARMYRAMTQKKADAAKAIEEKRAQLVEAQTKLAMLEVYRANQATLKQLREQREAAILAAKEAKQTLSEMKQQEKKALQEAARQFAVPGDVGGSGRGRKRACAAGEASAATEAAVTKDQADGTQGREVESEVSGMTV